MTKSEASYFENKWNEAKSTMNKHLLWECVYDCAKHSLLKYYNSKGLHFSNEYTNDLIMDITIKVFEDIRRKGWYPDSLASFVYYRLLAVVLDKRKQFEDKVLFSDEALQDYYEGKQYEEDYIQ